MEFLGKKQSLFANHIYIEEMWILLNDIYFF